MSYYFNGTNSYATAGVAIPSAVAGSEVPKTIVAYVKVESTAASKIICQLHRTTGFTTYQLLRGNTEGYPTLTHRYDTTSGVSELSNYSMVGAGWVLAHATFNGNADRQAGWHSSTDTDGRYASADTTSVTGATFNNVNVGYRPTNLEWFKGYIAYVAIYDKVLSDAELDELYTTQPESASSYGDCVAYWDMRDNEGTDTIPDLIGTVDLTLSTNGGSKPVYNSDNPTLGTGSSLKMKILPTSEFSDFFGG